MRRATKGSRSRRDPGVDSGPLRTVPENGRGIAQSGRKPALSAARPHLPSQCSARGRFSACLAHHEMLSPTTPFRWLTKAHWCVGPTRAGSLHSEAGAPSDGGHICRRECLIRASFSRVFGTLIERRQSGTVLPTPRPNRVNHKDYVPSKDLFRYDHLLPFRLFELRPLSIVPLFLQS